MNGKWKVAGLVFAAVVYLIVVIAVNSNLPRSTEGVEGIDHTTARIAQDDYTLCGIDCKVETSIGGFLSVHPTLTERADHKVDITWASWGWSFRAP